MKLCYRVVHYNHTNLSANLVVLVSYIYPCFQKTVMSSNAKPTLLRVAKDLCCHKAYFCWFLKQRVNSSVVYLGICFLSLNKYPFSANTVHWHIWILPITAKHQAKNILPDLFCYSMKNTQWLIHKAQKMEVMSEAVLLRGPGTF